MIEVQLRMRTVSTLNAREHWSARAKRAKFERQLAYFTLLGTRAKVPAGCVRVALTRIAAPRGRVLDTDNLCGALKAVRDGVADFLQRQDNDPDLEWIYNQTNGLLWSVSIRIEGCA